MNTIISNFIKYYFLVLRLFALILHSFIRGDGKISAYFRKKIENFMIFSPRYYKFKKLPAELKNSVMPLKILTSDLVKLYSRIKLPKSDKMPVIVFYHGQSENISKWQNTVFFLKNCGFGAAFPSFRGHYKSAGVPSEDGIYRDAKAVIEKLLSLGYDEKQIFLWGRSLGSYPAIRAATEFGVGGVIVESGISNIKSAGFSILKLCPFILLGTFCKKILESERFEQNFSNETNIKNVKCNILILHSLKDKKINFEQAEKLREQNPEAELILCKNGSHDTNEWCFEYVKSFIDKHYDQSKQDL